MSDTPSVPLRVATLIRDPGLAETVLAVLPQLPGPVERCDALPTDHGSAPMWSAESVPEVDLAIIELCQSPEQALEQIRKLTSRDHPPEVLLTGPELPAPALLEAMRAGVAEYLPVPHDAANLQAALQRVLTRRHSQGSQLQRPVPIRVVMVFGAAGGAGTSTFAVNLGMALAQRQTNPLLLDLALPGGGMDALLDLQPRYRLQDLVRNIERLDAALLDSHLMRHDSGLRLLSAASDEVESGQIRSDHIQRVLAAIPSTTRYVVVDAGNVLHERLRPVLTAADSIVHLVAPTLIALRNARRQTRALDLAAPGWRDRALTAITRQDPDLPITRRDIVRTLESAIAFELPEDESMRRRDATGNGPAMEHRHGAYARAFDRAIEALAPLLPMPADGGAVASRGASPLLGWLMPARRTGAGPSSSRPLGPRGPSESQAP